jgi:hypothetical protein
MIQNQLCNLPCWYGIIPGQTDKEGVISQIKQINEVIENSITFYSLPYTENIDVYDWKFKNAEESSGEIILKNNKVVIIQLIENPNSKMVFDIIDLYGEPDSYFSYYQQYESVSSYVLLFYSEKGVVVSVKSAYSLETKYAQITNESPIIEVTFLQDADINIIPDGFLVTSLTSSFINNNIRKWDGFKELNTVKVN